MEIKILFNNDALNNRFKTGWGFSCLVNETVLFDTGACPDALLHNMKLMKINCREIKTIVISHEHWDHIDGLWGFLTKNNDVTVYVCSGFSKEFKDRIKSYGTNIVEAGKTTMIKDAVFVTGEIQCLYKGLPMPEQALIILNEAGVNIITGCSHPGIINIIELVKKKYFVLPINLVVGGFHLKDTDKKSIESVIEKFKELGVKKVWPTHWLYGYLPKMGILIGRKLRSGKS